MAFTLGNLVLPGYPLSLGNKYLVAFEHTGPSSYTQFSTPSTGGDVLTANASGLNFSGFDYIDTDVVDTTGQININAVLNLGGYQNAVPQLILIYYSLVTATLGGQAQTANTQIVATTNLSTFSWRLRAICV